MRTNWISRLLRSEAVSNTSIFWFSIIGILSVVFGLPDPEAVDGLNLQWWIVAITSQAVFVLFLIAGRKIVNQLNIDDQVLANLSIIAIAGLARSCVLAVVIAELNLDSSFMFDHPMRLITSVIVCVIWMSALGLLFQSSRDYTVMYRQLLAQRVQLAAAENDTREIPEVLEQWSALRDQIIFATQEAHRHLDFPSESDGQAFQDAALVLGAAVENYVRPASYGLLAGPLAVTTPRVPFAASVKEVLRDWDLPKRGVVAVSGVFVMFASVSRSGGDGFFFGLEYIGFLTLVLWCMSYLVQRFPSRSAQITTSILIGFLVL